MRSRLAGSLMFLAALALGATAAAQTLPSRTLGAGYLPPLFAAEGVQRVEFTVEVVARTTPLTGTAGEQFLSFSGPVQVPGVGLAPGTYVFRLIEHSFMQVTSADRRTVYSLFPVVPVTRLVATATHEVRLERTAAEAPMRLTAIFAPGATQGYAPWFRPPSTCERILRDLNLPTDICKGA